MKFSPRLFALAAACALVSLFSACATADNAQNSPGTASGLGCRTLTL